jgi:outer membrane lipoprotein-sorting protein
LKIDGCRYAPLFLFQATIDLKDYKIMYKKHKKTITFLISFAVLLWFFVPANAYLLQGPHLLELMTQKHGKAENLFVSQKLVLYDESFKDGSIELKETLKYIFPEKFRSDIVSKNSKRIHVVSKGRSLTVIDGKTVAGLETIFDRYKDIILYNSRSALVQRLAQLGINVSVSSLGRFENKPVYVLGAQYPDESVSQIWLNKDTFKPFRWIINSKKPGGRIDFLEIRYYKWRKISKIWYPMHIEFYQDDSLIRMIDVDEIKVDPGISAGLFDINRLKSTYPKDTQVLPKQHQSGELSEVQKMIEEFKKIYE